MAATILNITDIATKLDTDPRTARKFLREVTPIDAQPGKGKRWGIEARQMQSLKAKFAKFIAAQDEAKREREAAAAIDREEDLLDPLEVAHDTFDDLDPANDDA